MIPPEAVAKIHTIGLYICHPLWIHTHTPIQPNIISPDSHREETSFFKEGLNF